MTITEFFNDMRTLHGASYDAIFVRGRNLAQRLHVRELRTKKHNHLACCWDELGNVIVLTRTGVVKQLIGAETKALPR